VCNQPGWVGFGPPKQIAEHEHMNMGVGQWEKRRGVTTVAERPGEKRPPPLPLIAFYHFVFMVFLQGAADWVFILFCIFLFSSSSF